MALDAGKTPMVEFLLNQTGVALGDLDFEKCKDKDLKKLVKEKQ